MEIHGLAPRATKGRNHSEEAGGRGLKLANTKGRERCDQSLPEKSRTKVKKFDWRTAQKGQFFQKTRRKHRKRASNVRTLGTRLGPTKSCVIDVSTSQIDELDAQFVEEQWDRVVWQQKIQIPIAKIAGNQTQNK